MKPALEAVVYCSPTVWNPYPANSASPATAPAPTSPCRPPAASRGRNAASSSAAARNR
jgi:hypothetical protein